MSDYPKRVEMGGHKFTVHKTKWGYMAVPDDEDWLLRILHEAKLQDWKGGKK
jgi:hypothetical protein